MRFPAIAVIATVAATAAAAATKETWTPAVFTDPITDEKTYTVATEAVSGDEMLFNRARLSIACFPNGKTSAGIDWPLISPNAAGEAEIIVRFDGEKPATAKWTRRDNSTVINDAIPFLRETAKHEKLAVRTTLGDRTYTAVFDVSRMGEKAAATVRECGWQF